MNRSQVPGFRQRCVLLCTSYIVGASFNKGKLEWLAHQPFGTMFALEAEPENPWDPNAVLVKTIEQLLGEGSLQYSGERVGFIARSHNLVPSQLLKANMPLCAVLVGSDFKAKVNSRYLVAVYAVLA